MKTQTSWNLSSFYKDVTDPAIERDQRKADLAVAAFAKKYRKDKKHLKSPMALAKALEEYEKLILLPSSKAGYYVFYRKDLNVEDKAAEALGAKLDDRGTKRGNQLIFFTLEIGKVPLATQKKFLKAKELAPFRYWLKQVFEDARFTLSEPEEKILSLKSDVSSGRWVQATENVLNKQVVTFGKEILPLPKAESMIQNLPTTKRRALWKAVTERYVAVSDMAESELNAIYTNKKINDELRGYKTPYEATIRGYQNEEKSILALVDAVTRANGVAQRFFKIKAKLLKEEHLTYADRAAVVGKLGGKIPFDKAAKEVREVFGNLKPLYADIFDTMLENGRIDVYPKKGKTGGAYCSSGVTVPTFVLLNHVDTFESLKTLAHEMGHAVHAERSHTQRPFYDGHTISTAETASTFFEYAALRNFVDRLPEKDKIIALHNIIQDDVATVFRQIAFFNFEKSLHDAVRKDGYVPKEKIATLMNDAVRKYLGPAFKLEEADGYFFVTISHIRRFFYVYSYAYGQLISKGLHRHLEKNPKFIDKVDQFLCAGESDSPENIFASIGVNTRSPKIFEEGIASIEEDVKRLEKLVG